MILTGEATPSDLDNVRELLESQPRAYALGLSETGLVAFGPGGQIEVWGETQPRVILGRNQLPLTAMTAPDAIFIKLRRLMPF